MSDETTAVEWITAAEVSEYLVGDDSLATDSRIVRAAAASVAWCSRRRPDIAPDADPGDDVRMAAIMFAARLFRQRGSSTPTAEDLAGIDDDGGMGTIMALLGRRGVAR